MDKKTGTFLDSGVFFLAKFPDLNFRFPVLGLIFGLMLPGPAIVLFFEKKPDSGPSSS